MEKSTNNEKTTDNSSNDKQQATPGAPTNTQVPTQAEANKKIWFARHKILTIILALILIGVIGSFFGSKKKVDLGAASTPASDSSQQATAAKAYNQTPVPVTPKVYTGSGDDVIDITKPANGPEILTFECSTCADNTVVKTNGAESLLVNTIGGYAGSHLIDISSGSNTTQVTITASGSWTLTVSGLDKATPSSGQAVSGKGDSVLHVTGKTTKAALLNSGDENFVVNVYPESGGYADLAVNTIGSYRGTVPLKTPAYVQITSNGDWSVTPK